MSEYITSTNLDSVVQENNKIRDEIYAQAMRFRTNPAIINIPSMPTLGMQILKEHGLIQMPIEDKYWSGAIFVKEGKTIPVINTAQPRVNQYFTAWHEVYHLMYDQISLDHFISSEQIMEERKADLFAANMLLSGVESYFINLSYADFIDKILMCMSTFQAPYKAVLISLYEYAVKSGNAALADNIKKIFDLKIDDFSDRFCKLGLDESLVLPSFVINVTELHNRISKRKEKEPELNYHQENEDYLINIIQEFSMIERDIDD